MRWKVIYTDTALKDLERLNIKTAQRIALKIRYYSEQSNPLRFAKALNPPYKSLYRFRVGEYRAIFEIDARRVITLLTILRIKHRKDIYE